MKVKMLMMKVKILMMKVKMLMNVNINEMLTYVLTNDLNLGIASLVTNFYTLDI